MPTRFVLSFYRREAWGSDRSHDSGQIQVFCTVLHFTPYPFSASILLYIAYCRPVSWTPKLPWVGRNSGPGCLRVASYGTLRILLLLSPVLLQEKKVSALLTSGAKTQSWLSYGVTSVELCILGGIDVNKRDQIVRGVAFGELSPCSWNSPMTICFLQASTGTNFRSRRKWKEGEVCWCWCWAPWKETRPQLTQNPLPDMGVIQCGVPAKPILQQKVTVGALAGDTSRGMAQLTHGSRRKTRSLWF